MLGDLVYEGQSKVVGMRVLPDGKIEQTVVLMGRLPKDEEDFTVTYTGNVQMRPDGTMNLEFHGIFSTPSEPMGRITGEGNGITRPDGTMTVRGVICHNNPPGKYAKYNGMAVVFEADRDKNGNSTSKGWEWK